MKILLITISVILLLIPIIVGTLIWVYLKDEIKIMFQFYKEMAKELPSFKKSKVDVKKILIDLKKNKELLKK